MSYLEMEGAPLDDADKMIISFWFRDTTRYDKGDTLPGGGTATTAPTQPKMDPPNADPWPQGFWTEHSKTMVPPNSQYSISNDPAFKNCAFYWNSYGPAVLSGFGAFVFGDLFLGPAACWIPGPPPLATNTMAVNPGASSIGGVADQDMSKFGIRTLLCFGDDKIPYNYCSWHSEDPGVIDAVDYMAIGFASAAGIITEITPPPYKPYSHNEGDNGHFHIRNFRIDSPEERKEVTVPQSFIGIDKDGYIVINLQTSAVAHKKGMSYELTNITELWAAQTHLVIDGPPFTYGQVGFPYPDGHWVREGGYWNGYEFEYDDISSKIMGCVPEAFLICGRPTGLFDLANAPVIKDGGWHHLLFSFDISGSVHAERPSVVDKSGGQQPNEWIWSQGAPEVSSSCKAWLAVDDQNMKGNDLQNRPPVHDGFLLPKLRGTETTQLLDCGPNTSYSRSQLKLDDNAILPRTAWLTGSGGNPKDGLVGFAANTGIVDTQSGDPTIACSSQDAVDSLGSSNGDFNPLPWTGAVWPLYGGRAPGPWQGICYPAKPTKPDPPSTLDHPTYDCSGFKIPLKGKPIGVPCSVSHEKNNTGVEMAELQIWVGQSIDLGDERSRRLFIDWPKDKDGKPDKTKAMIPVRPTVAERALGKPDILLHGTGNWKKGRNTGKSAVNKDTGKPDPKGQFAVIAKVEKFVPDPKLSQ